MKGFLKGVFLIAILAIPVVIYVFLKLFGKNEFSIPVYYENGVEVSFPGCNFNVVPHTLDIDPSKIQQANVTVFFQRGEGFQATDLYNIERRLKAVFPENFTFSAYGLGAQEVGNFTVLDSLEFKRSMHCDFVTDTVNQFILHDGKGLIRGYYHTDLEEVDRLIVETKIVLEDE